ncbi:MAG: hypothetical protein JO235_16505 [Chroococcidiopsidaceae cyanobacterium CP_BM_RX_35]|nr:hypothetical protein [Chroococcidiopsidaceae cyanobacterium CP_BM_RX_35]
MPAISLYFTDPDGHLLEYLAMLPQEPCPDVGVVPYSQWQAMQLSSSMADFNAP